MQKAETGVMEKPKKEVHLTKLADISVDKDNKIYVNWPVDKKELVLMSLAEAMKLVISYRANIIEKPKPNFMDFVRGTKT